MIKNLKLPVKVINGEICDADGKSIIGSINENSSPLKPTERDELIRKIASLLNKNVNESLNENAQIGDKVIYNKQKGFIIGQTSDGDYLVQVQGNTSFVKPSEVKVLGVKPKTLDLPFKFDEKTQKVLFEQFIKCGIYMGNTPVKISNCFVKYSQWASVALHENVNVIADGELNIMPKENVRIFEDPNNFANPNDYVEGVIIDELTGDAKESVLINAIDYSSSIGDVDGIKVIRGHKTDNPQLETIPKAVLRTLSV